MLGPVRLPLAGASRLPRWTLIWEPSPGAIALKANEITDWSPAGVTGLFNPPPKALAAFGAPTVATYGVDGVPEPGLP